MKVVFITSSHYLDTAVPLINALLKYLDVTVIVNCLKEEKKIFFPPRNFDLKRTSIIEVSSDEVKNLPGYAGLLKEGGKKLKVAFVFFKNFKVLSLSAWMSMYKIKKYFSDAEFIHVQSLTAHNYFTVNKNHNKKIIVDIHDVIQHSGCKLSFWSKFIVNKWFSLADEIIIHNSTGVDYMENVLKLSKTKINVLPFGLILLTAKQIKPDACSDKPTILFFGRICLYKGIEYLIEAISVVKKEVSNLRVIIAGKGKYDFGISKIKNDVTYEIINHYIPNEQLEALINRSTIVVCPYTDATQSGVLMTALAFNKPVVATNVGGVPEVIEDEITGRLVPPKDSQQLAKALVDLLANPEKRDKISENIKKKFSQEKFSWDYIARKTMEVYKNTE